MRSVSREPSCLCYITSIMKRRQRRSGATETFSVSVDRKTKLLLKAAAEEEYGGNVSALITELAKEVARRKAAGEYLRSLGIATMTDTEADAFEREIERELASRPKRSRAGSKRTAA